MPRDPLTDPRTNDIIQAASDVFPFNFPPMKVEAVVDNLVAVSDINTNEISWRHLDSWCKTNKIITHWKVIHAA